MSKNFQCSKIWAIVPAAGIGKRMGSSIPKQYLPIGNGTVLEYTLEKLLALDAIEGVILSLADNDEYWLRSHLYRHPKIHIAPGGKERSDSVLSGINYLLNSLEHNQSGEDVWALVHDAARPCVSIERVQALISQVLIKAEHKFPCGGILAVPAADTIKRADGEGDVEATEDRSLLWHAHTPQFFPVLELKRALTECARNGHVVTDEASSMEAMGVPVSLVEDRRDNIKVTMPEDLAWAEFILKSQLDSDD